MAISWNNQKDNKALAWKEINLIKNRKVLPWNKTTNKDSNVLDLNKESSTEISTTRNLPVIESLSPQVEKQMEEEKAELNKNTWLRQVQRFLLPKELEIRYGFTEPGFWDKIDKVEGERMLYMREQHFKDLYEQEVKETPKISEDYEEPDTFIGQVLESAKMGYISSIKGNTGYFIESLGREIGSTKMVQWGMDVGDKAIIEVLKNPELFAPEDLKPFFEGGIVDKRWWARAIGQSLPFMATTITTATIGGLMGGPVGAAGGGFLSSASLEKGGSYKKYIDEGVPLDKADTYSNFYGVIAGTIENAIGISPARIGGMLSYKGAERVIANSYKSFLFREIPKIGIQTLKTALEEGGEEVAQSITENLILKFFKTETPVLTKDLAEEFASGFAAAIPFGASNIRIPEIVKDNNENQEKIEELINSTDKAFKEQESEILEKVQKNIDFYQSTGTSHEGDIQPVNAGLLELQKLADNKEVIEKTQEQIKPLIEDDGMITLYRVGEPTDVDRFVSATYDKDFAEEFAEGVEATRDVKPTITETRVRPEDIKIFIGGAEKEVLVPSSVYRTQDPLIQEAQKYKSAEEFVEAQFSKKPEYGMGHRPSYEGMPPSYNLLEGETLPRDVYTHPDFSIASGRIRSSDKAATESWNVLQKIKGKPEAEVTLYRAGAKNELNTGDWVTFSKEYAKQSLEGMEKIYSFKAKAKDVIFAGDDINEFGYYPKSQLTDIWNQAQTTFKKITSKFPENKYKLNLLDEINKAKSLPRIDSNAFDWIPPTVSYNNPYTRVMTKAWDKISNVWDSKAPLVVKQFHSKEVGNIIKERQRVYDGLTKKYEEEIVRPVTKLTKEEKEKIGNMIFKRIKIPEDYKATIKNIDFKIGQLGNAIVNIDKEMIANKQLKKEDSLLTEKTWAENLGEYARTLYVKEENGEAKITARSEVTKNGVINRSAFKKKMTDEEWGANALKFEGKTIEEIEQYSLEELKEIGEEAKENYGWTVQADYILSRTFIDLTKSYTTRLFQKEIVENQRLFTNNFKTAEKMGFIPIRDVLPKPLKIKTDDNFITVSQAKKLGPLAHGYIHEGLQDEIKTFINPQEMDSVMAIFQGPLSWWKIFKVAANPATVVRNFISGAAAQTDLAGYPVWTIKNSKRYAQAVKSYITRDSLYKELRDGGQYGSDYHSVEVSQDEMSKIVNRAEKSNNSYQEYTGELLNKLTSIISESGNKLEDSKELFNYYGHIDHIQRTYLALCAKEDGARTSQAVHFANKWELDYRFVPKFVDSLRSGLPGWLFPFLSFYTLMAPRVAETLITRPWVLVKYPLIFAALNSISMALLGVDDDEIENAKPEWLEGNNYTIILPKKDKNGDFVFLNLDYTLPFGGWKDAFMDIDQVVQMTKSPGIMSGVLGILNNYDFFTEKKIYNETDLNEEKRKKIAKYIVSSFGPGFVTHAINIYDVSKGEKSGFPIEKEKSLKVAIGKAAGISLYSGGFNEAYWKIKNIKSEISEIQWAMKLFMQDENISSEEKQEKLIEFREEIQIRKEKIRDISNNMPSQQSNNKKTEVIPFNQ
jgi:hypothetical protein